MMTRKRITNVLMGAIVAVMAMVFTTAPANADFLTPTGATVSQVSYGSAAAMINGSGISGEVTTNSVHGGSYNEMWMAGVAPPTWAKFDLGAKYDLTEAYIWNGHYDIRYGVVTMDMFVSADDVSYTQVGGTVTLQLTNATVQVKSLVASGVRYVRFDPLTGGPGHARHGLAEVRFEGFLPTAGAVITIW